MKEKLNCLFIILFTPALVLAQNKNNGIKPDSGIHFEKGLTWQQIQAKAKAEKKLIFIDCYATWCGPCKFMSERIFTQPKVGDYMNVHFINVAVQTDRTSKDNEDIQKWYGDAQAIVDKYSINAFPTYLLFSPDGQPLHRIVGVTGNDGVNFIDKVKDVFEPQKQYYNYIGNYQAHLNDSMYLRNALTMSLNLRDLRNAEAISDAYVNCLADPFREYSLLLIKKSIQSSKDKGFSFFLKDAFKIDSVFDGEAVAEDCVWRIIADEEINPLFMHGKFPIVWKDLLASLKVKYPELNISIINSLYANYEYQVLRYEIQLPLYKTKSSETTLANWDKIFNQIKIRYPGYDPGKMIAIEKEKYFAFKKMWPECENAALSCADKYGNELTRDELNTFAWDAFMHSTDRNFLLEAAKWSRRTIPEPSDTAAYKYSSTYEFIDTYANLLYKLGEKDKAIFWEEKALGLASKFRDGSDINYKITLKKMEHGENTWEGRDSRFEEYQ